MTGAGLLAVLLTLLAGLALGLAWAGGRRILDHARIRSRAQWIAHARDRAGDPGRLQRAPDPLIAGGRSAADLWLLEHLPGGGALGAQMRQAGMAMAISRFVMLLAATGFAALVGLIVAGASPALALPIAVAAIALGPRLVLGWRIKRRRRQFERLLPEAIGLMVRGLRAGVPVSETVAEVGAEVIDPLGGAFRRAHEQVRLGQSLEAALLAETAALESPSMSFLIVTLSVQRETGGNLAETLDKLDDIMRRREQMRLKVKAMSSEAKASALIIGSLPLLMAGLMAMVAPDYIAPLFTTTAGHVLLGGAAASLAAGGWLMAQLVAFEV